METHGEGGGGEAGRRGRSELGSLLEAIGSSEVLEKRIPLIKQLEEFSADDLDLIIQGLLESWIDSTCSGVSHCTLHRSILQVALKCSDLDITDYHLGQFLTLGAKASSWCVKHLQWHVKPIDQSQVAQEEEHNRLRLEVNSLSISISTKLLDIAEKCITVLGLEVAAGEGGQGAAAEECVLNKAEEVFPTLEAMVEEVEPAPADLAVGMPQEASRRCTHCVTEKTPQWRLGPDGPCTLCNACWHQYTKGRPVHSNCRRRPSNKRRPSDDFEALVGVPSENGNGMAMAPWSLAPLPQEAVRRCMHCASEKTPQWRLGPDGPRTLCNACGQLFLKGRLLHSNTKKRRSSSTENSAALLEMLPCGVGASLDAFFGHTGLDMSWEEAGPEQAAAEEEELEWLSNRDAFPSVETMAVKVEAPPLGTPPARTKGQRRVTANGIQRRCRCTHCTTEETPEWREGPEGPHTLCNACGIVFRKYGLLLPEYRPAKSPGFSRLLHSRTYSRALEMHRQNESMEVQLLSVPEGPLVDFSLLLRSGFHHQSDEEAFAGICGTAKARCAAACLAASKD